MTIDAADLDAAYARIARPLYNVLYRWLWNPQDCQDLIHETFLRVWARHGSTDPERLDRLLYSTALNLAKNRLRWRKLWRFAEPAEAHDAADSADEPDAFAQRAADRDKVRRALDQLDATARNVLLLSEFAGLDTAELAAVLGVARGTVGSRRHRALARLRLLLEDNGHE